MTIHWLLIPVSLIREDPKYPDQDTRCIFEHLKYFLSLPSAYPLPAIVLEGADGGFVVVRGHKYRRSPISIATGRRISLEENLGGSSESKTRAGAVVESFFHPAHLVMGDVAEVGPLGKILAD